MTVILGIDPGSRVTGFGLIRIEGPEIVYIDSGCIRLSSQSLSERLQYIFQELSGVNDRYQPQEAAIEQVFMHQNPGAAIKLGQARGAAIVALRIPVAEYSARQVKQSVVGYGAAKKEQVQHMVRILLKLAETPEADAADALAVALCHAHTRNTVGMTYARPKRARSSSWRHYLPE